MPEIKEEGNGRVLGEGEAEQEWPLPRWVARSPGHTHQQLLVPIPSHTQTKRSLQLHELPTWSQEDVFRRYGREGDLLTSNLEGGAEERGSGRPPTGSHGHPPQQS